VARFLVDRVFLPGLAFKSTMKKMVIEFCGVRPVGVTSFGSARQSTPAGRESGLAKAHQAGKAAL